MLSGVPEGGRQITVADVLKKFEHADRMTWGVLVTPALENRKLLPANLGHHGVPHSLQSLH